MAVERPIGAIAVPALRSPAAIGLAVAGAGASVVAGLPILAAAGIGAAAYGIGAVVAGILRRGRRRMRPGRERIDPFTLGEPWRLRVREALNARTRYETVVEAMPAGPLRERLAEIGLRIEAGVAECWRIAKQGNALGQGLRLVGIGEIRAAVASAEASGAARTDPRVAALRAQLASAERMATTAADADGRLKLLSARLDESAARAIELSLGAGTDADLVGLGSEVDEVVDQLESLRLALGEVGG